MNSSVLPWIKKTVFAHQESDQLVADRERLEHELAVKDEEIAELRCRVEELEAEAMEAAGNYRRPQVQSIVRAVQS